VSVDTSANDYAALEKLWQVRSPQPRLPLPVPLRFDVDCSLQYELDDVCHFIFQIEAIDLPEQRIIAERLTLQPAIHMRSFSHEPTGNRLMRGDVPAGFLHVRYQATIDVTPPTYDTNKLPESSVSQIPSEFVHLLAPTRYCESDLLAAAAQNMFGKLPPGWARVEAIREWIHDNVEYVVASSDTTTTACDVFVQRKGVCRDFAHLGIAFCRALNIPARFVVGYIKFPDGAPDFHAVFEAWLGDRWVIFDATEMAPVEWLIRVGTGRDAKDVPFATIYGPARMLSMAPTVERSASTAN
jgi:transglutaminase-like putative cysteine protease